MACTNGSCSTATGTTGIVCGTGGWTGPKPGDPENIPSIRARGIVGAIEVSWFYPTINSHSVGHFRVYRGTNAEFALAVERGIISASIFVDQIPENETREYYYWVRMVSVNGTVMDPVGPASATPHKLSEDLLEKLTAEIDESKLSQSLRERIGLIEGIRRDIAQETLDRIHANSTFANALVHVQTTADQVATYVQNEVIQRQDADSALVESVSALATGFSENEALIIAEQVSRTTADEALASDISILYTNVDENKAAILQEQQARSDTESAVASQLNALVTKMGDNSAAIETEKKARTSADSAIITDVSNWAAKTNTAAAGLANEIVARTNADTSLAQQIQTAQTQLGSNLASVQTTLQTQINATDGKVNNIGALWTAKVDVNGLVGGFGVYNNGQFVEAGFDVDRFWVGRTRDKVKPFIVDSGVVYIDKARIRNADIDTLKLAGSSVTVSQYGYGQLYQPGGYLFTNTSWRTIASIPLSLQGMAPGETAGTIIIGTANILEEGGPTVTFNVGIFINEQLISMSGITLGPSQSLTVVGFTSQQNGTYTVSIRARVGPPWPDKLANVMRNIIFMSGKR